MPYHSHMAFRVGDYIDDYCSRCKFSSDHTIESLVGEEVKKVRCRTCMAEHNYRGNKGPREETAKDVWDRMIAGVSGSPVVEQATRKKSRSKSPSKK